MPRIPYPDPATLSDDVRRLMGNKPANVIRMMGGASEAMAKGFAALGGAVINGSPLAPKLREIAILRVGYLSNAKYEVFQHEALARHVGLSESQIEAIRRGKQAGELGDAGAAVLAFTDDVVRNVRPGDDTLSAVRAHLSDVEAIDLTLVIGMYMMVSRFLETTGVEIDDVPIDWQELTPA